MVALKIFKFVGGMHIRQTSSQPPASILVPLTASHECKDNGTKEKWLS